MKKNIAYFTFCLLSFSLCAGELIVSTTPEESLILIRRPSAMDATVVGRASKNIPFKMKIDELVKKYGENGMLVVVARKDGFIDNQVLIGHVGSEQIKLKLFLEPKQKIEQFSKLDDLINSLFEAQRLTRVGDYSSALKSIDSINKDYRRLSTVYEMKGSIYYFMKDYNKSLGSFRKAFNLNPNNLDAYYFKLQLEKMLGVSKKEIAKK